jgi:hypothetical protein
LCTNEEDSTEVYIAGQRVAPGTYRELGTLRSIFLDKEDTLPASLNGRVAAYIRQPMTFAEMQRIPLPYAKAG